MQETQITHLQKIEIKGLWSKYNIEWELHPEVNILAGANGTGKSTVLKLIAGVLTGGPFAKEVDEKIEEVKITFNGDDNVVRAVTGTASNLKRRAEMDKQMEPLLGVLNQIEERESSAKTKKLGIFLFSNNLSKATRENIKDFLPTVSVVSTFDEPIRELYKTIEFQAAPKEVETYLDFLIYQTQRAYLSYQIDLGKKFERAIILNEKESTDAKRLRETIYGKKDLFYQTVNELFQETGKTIESDKQNEIAFRHGEQVLTPYQLSSGEKQVLLILLTVLIQDNQPAILLMDEPEISLHVDWQKRLIDDVRNLNNHAQVILATHSPVVVMRGWMDRVVELADITRKI